VSILQNDSDAVLIDRLFGPDAAASRAGLAADVAAEIDDAAVEVLEGKNLADLPEEDAEHLSRELAGRIRSILSKHIVQLGATVTALGAEVKHVDAEVERLEREKEDIERRLKEEGE
jgi:predicted RNase H-like nuclease (RuvC/YqgF family)